MLLRLTTDEGDTIVINFSNVLFMEKGRDEHAEQTVVCMVGEINILVQDDLDEILASYRREWKST
jgi:hypothetical protein